MPLTSEQEYYADLAALLDPACYHYLSGASWSVTVPAGEIWYGLNIWNAKLPGGSTCLFHRDADAQSPMPMPAGMSYTSADPQAFILYARPLDVQATDARYLDDPRALYFERLAKLQAIPMLSLTVNRAAGTPFATNSQKYINNGYPNFAKGIVRQWQLHDGSWMCMLGPGTNIINTQMERNDKYPIRKTGAVLFPFMTSMFCGLWLNNGSEGDYTVNGPQTYNGYGAMHYQVLPADW
jgi:hypothetical protein